MLVLEGLVGLQRTVQLQLLQHYWLGVDLDSCDIEWFGLKTNRDHFVTRVYVPQFFVSSQQRFGATDIKALGTSQLSGLGQTVL